MEFICSVCGQVHEEMPAIGFKSPFHYDTLSDNDKQTIAEISSDFCVIRHDTQTDQFIRGVLFQKIIDSEEDLQYGVWVSLSKKSFTDYQDNFDLDTHEATYFGYLCNEILPYDDTLSIRANVQCSGDGMRPEIVPHKSQNDNQFVNDYYNGITREEAERRIHEIL